MSHPLPGLPLVGQFPAHGILSRWVQDGDAHVSVHVHVRVPQRSLERELRGRVGVVLREGYLSLEVAPRVGRVGGAEYDHVPVQNVLLVSLGISGLVNSFHALVKQLPTNQITFKFCHTTFGDLIPTTLD